jgi:hypothetical protein
MQGSRGLGQSGLPFDSSSFPSLGSTQHAQQQPGGRGNLSGYNSAAMYGGNAGHIREEDFTIEKEDFPALPGSQKHSDSGAASSLHGLAGRDLGLVGAGAGSGGAAGSIGSSQHQQQLQTQQQSTEYVGGAFATLGTPGFDRANGGLNFSGLLGPQAVQGGSSTGVATSAETRFGLGGLLDIIRMTDKVRLVASPMLSYCLVLGCITCVAFTGTVLASDLYHLHETEPHLRFVPTLLTCTVTCTGC